MLTYFTSVKIKEINSHIFIDDDQHVLVDTGSQVSFHSSGQIIIGEEQIQVSTSIPLVSQEYLSEKIGYEVNGLLGMDVIGQQPTLIDLKTGLMFFNDDAQFACMLKKSTAADKMEELMGSLGGLLENFGGLLDGLGTIGNLASVVIGVNGKKANMIVDSGAKISFIEKSFVSGMKPQYYIDDFHHSVGDFQTPVYRCETNLFVAEPYFQDYGILPEPLLSTLNMFQIDGIIGLDLFKRFRLQFKEGYIFFPPQGI